MCSLYWERENQQVFSRCQHPKQWWLCRQSLHRTGGKFCNFFQHNFIEIKTKQTIACNWNFSLAFGWFGAYAMFHWFEKKMQNIFLHWNITTSNNNTYLQKKRRKKSKKKQNFCIGDLCDTVICFSFVVVVVFSLISYRLLFCFKFLVWQRVQQSYGWVCELYDCLYCGRQKNSIFYYY